MKINKIILLGTLLGLSVTGCKKDFDTDVSSSNVSSKEFSYSTAGAVEMNLTGK